MMRQIWYVIFSVAVLSQCKNDVEIAGNVPTAIPDSAFFITKTLSNQQIQVDVLIDKPLRYNGKVLMVFHGTVNVDSKIKEAAHNTLDAFKKILSDENMMLISVAYPEENLLMGDNVAHAELALLWAKNKAETELGVNIKKLFLAGHSQGGYIVTRLNTMHTTNGVIANAPGPLNLVYRCKLEEQGSINPSPTCNLIRATYGTTVENPAAYSNRSLLSFTTAYRSDILVVQGLSDSPIQMNGWPVFKQKMNDCIDCAQRLVVEVPQKGHTSLFEDTTAIAAFNTFISER